jgi:hypothetical protein
LSTYSVVDERSHARRLVAAVCDLDLCNVIATT